MKHIRKDYNDRVQDAHGLIPDDEPVFLIRAQDSVSGPTVRHWASLYAGQEGADPKIVAQALAHAELMDQWPKKKVADQ